jgi:hypothetical protein
MADRLAPRLSQNAAGDYDLVLEDGKFKWAEDGTVVAQHGTERILIFKGELSLNDQLSGKDDEGTRYYEVLFSAAASRAEKELEIKQRILGTPGALKTLQFTFELDGGTLTTDGQVLTEYGTVDVSQTVEVL